MRLRTKAALQAFLGRDLQRIFEYVVSYAAAVGGIVMAQELVRSTPGLAGDLWSLYRFDVWSIGTVGQVRVGIELWSGWKMSRGVLWPGRIRGPEGVWLGSG